MSTKHHLVVMAAGLPACPECHLPAQSVTCLPKVSPAGPDHCQTVPTSLSSCANVTARLCPAPCQILPSFLPALTQITVKLCPDLHQAHFQAFPRSPPSFAQLIARPCPAHHSKVPKHSSRAHTMSVVFFTADRAQWKDSAELVPAALTQTFVLLKERQQLGISTSIHCCCLTVGMFLVDLRLRPVLRMVGQVPIDLPQEHLLLPVVLPGV